ncbi:MAG: M20 family metallo-hydrolase [Proteobacteria bacterium]|nr:M20 family metallo-hydrolase [Pseudomonadota bacterium]
MAAAKRAKDSAASSFVSEERLWRRHMEMAKIGATAKGGVNRQALTPEDARARALLAEWARGLGFACAMDAIGNVFIRRPGAQAAAAPVISGSHTDSQPSGGRFDGISGVLAALEALEAMNQAGIETRRPVEAAVWTNEEGSRFASGCMGSQVYTEPAKLARMLAMKDLDGMSLKEALAATRAAMPTLPERPLKSPIDCFVELHIEQGPVLEATGNVIGIVTGIAGSRRFEVEVLGEDAHAGTTPRARRKDAVLAASAMIQALHKMMADPEDEVRFTIGQIRVKPNAMAVVPGYVLFTIDFRHQSEEVLTRLGDRIEGVCRAQAGPCEVTLTETRRAPTKMFSGLVPDAIEAVTRKLGVPYMRLFSGAGHDARYVADLCPTGMIFVPCEKGISHNEAENAKPSDLAAGARVLADTLVALANR